MIFNYWNKRYNSMSLIKTDFPANVYIKGKEGEKRVQQH